MYLVVLCSSTVSKAVLSVVMFRSYCISVDGSDATADDTSILTLPNAND
jgi:hypothetical protein